MRDLTVTLIYEHPYNTPEHPAHTQITGVQINWIRNNMRVMNASGHKLWMVKHINPNLVTDCWRIWDEITGGAHDV